MAQLLRQALQQSGLMGPVSSVIKRPAMMEGLRYASLNSYQGSKGNEPAPAQSPDTKAVETTAKDDGTWTEVVHEATGQTYWWNQQTGQTTALGQPIPGSKQEGGSEGEAGSSGGGGSSQFVDPRAEPPLPDKTGQYAAFGAIMGVFLGWASQFF